MKSRKLLLLFIFMIFIMSCAERDVDKEIKTKLTEFYTSSEVKNYEPILYSELDTIELIQDLDSSLIRLKGTVFHEFYARSNDGDILKYSSTIDVTIFESEIIVIPRYIKNLVNQNKAL